MTDSFKKAIEEIALHDDANGGTDSHSVLNAVIALEHSTSDKLDIIHKEILDNRTATSEMLVRHQKEFMHMSQKEFDLWILDYSNKRDKFSIEVADRATESHVKFHNNYVKSLAAQQIPHHRETDPMTSDHMKERELFLERPVALMQKEEEKQHFLLWFFASNIGKVVMALIAGIMLWGVTFWADNCSREQYWGDTPPAIVVTTTPQPMPTSTPTVLP
jgi:hypothetical protein